MRVPLVIGGVLSRLRSKNLHTWLGGYARHRVERLVRGRAPSGKRHVLFAICDHYEPRWGEPSDEVANRRVDAWMDRYAPLFGDLRDADGRSPQHSFFFPGDQLDEKHLAQLADLCGAGHGEVEVHLHHRNDTVETLRAQLEHTVRRFAAHGHLTRAGDGTPRYAFIHGNWALANGRPDGDWCGVDEELPLLYDTGCYADFTFPAAPDICQPNIVNQIYWPVGDLTRARCYENGRSARIGDWLDDRLLLITGPLALTRREGKLTVRIENGDLNGSDPPTLARARSWVEQSIAIGGRPEWLFVKLYTHGAPEKNADMLLSASTRRFHQELLGEFNDGERWGLHYVTAREMYNIARAAIDGKSGDPGQYRDYHFAPPPVRQTSGASI